MMGWRRRDRRSLGESGQAIAEFGLVLPMLALLTFGTIEVAIYLQQQAAINGVAFVAARAASVTGGEGRYGKEAAKEVADRAGMPWLEQAAAGVKVEGGGGATRARLVAKTDRFSGVISALAGNGRGFDQLGGVATLPVEWEAKKHRQTSPTGKPRTMYRVSYEGKLPMPSALTKAKAAIDKARSVLAKLDGKIVVPAPPPPPAPPAPPSRPTGSGGGAAPPAPKPPAPKPPAPKPPGGGGGQGGPTVITPGGKPPAPKPPAPKPPAPKPPAPKPPGPKPPAPKPQAPQVFEIPGLPDIKAFLAGAWDEPFSDRYAVVPNPRKRNDAGDGGEGTSSEYLMASYEERPIKAGEFPWKLSTLMEGLKKYEEKVGGKSGTLEAGCKTLGPWPPQSIRTAINTNPLAAVVLKGLDVAKGAVGSQGATLAQSMEKAYQDLDKSERKLYRGGR